MKKIIYILLLFVLVVVAGCSDDQKSSPTVIIDDSTEVAEKDQLRPSKSNLEYLDHSEFADGESKLLYDEAKWYVNMLKNVPLPDPHVLEVGGVYYIYGTTDRSGAQTMDCYTTEDFISYELHRDIYVVNSAWEGKVIYAPEIYQFGDYFYLYYSNASKLDGRRYIHVVRADNPLGPFKQITDEQNAYDEMVDGYSEPIFQYGGNSVLDQTLFFDDDGKMYMYLAVSGSTQHVVGVEMLDHLTPNWSTYREIVIPGEINNETRGTKMLQWETFNGYCIAEAPYMIKSPNGKYYMTYSVNSYDDRYYSICYAVGDSPLGVFTKPYTAEDKKQGNMWTNLLIGYGGGMEGTAVYDKWEGFNSGVGHHCFFNIGDQVMIGYHAHTNRKNVSQGRGFAMDYLFFDEDGTPYAEGPTYSIQPLPEALSGYKNIALDAKVKSFNVLNAEMVNDNYIVRNSNLRQEEGKEVVLNPGYAYIELVFDKEYSIGGISIYNSAFYDNALSEIEWINFDNDNVIYNCGFAINYLNDEKEFIYPTSAFTVEFDDIKATRVVICINTTNGAQLNEIKVLGK